MDNSNNLSGIGELANACNAISSQLKASPGDLYSPITSQLSSLPGNLYSPITSYYDDSIIKVDSSSILSTSSIYSSKTEEILDDIHNFCKNYCFAGTTEVCDPECKCECPLWNRLKCERRV